ncbi:putative oxidoreductase [Gordonia effusa NBRC 100432]|uniref:Putative oxidoreductase n=1 Tax=Gordonia effusa NBRC 100432 TaxID=1077974 RepID=H0QYA9_9ACTN|nr:FdhF/YdeP family oxidoreductase [Gordonia effusa]GAB17810.1 putative oxidoreductase [Gordonia effusa NBRC 100432]
MTIDHSPKPKVHKPVPTSPPSAENTATDRVPGLAPTVPRQGGFGPLTDGKWSSKPYRHAAASWGAAQSVGMILAKQRELGRGTHSMFVMNHSDGYDCPGCAWPDDNKLTLDFCENGVKHVTWEMTPKRVDSRFFAEHTVTELADWTDFDLENQGRLTEPMRYDPDTDRYLPISWASAFEMIGGTLRSLASPDQASFYTSGRLSNEATFLYQLLAREYGTNNVPDCSNMCHEASGRALTASIGTGKGTVDTHDWEQAELLFVMGNNAASNAPRMLTALAEATRRGAKIVHINPMVEVGATKTIVPHEMLEMALFRATKTSDLNLQVRPGGDLALIRGVAKTVFEAAATDPTVLDNEFLAEYTHQLDEYRALVESTTWDDLVTQSGLAEELIREVGRWYIESGKTIISWCLGITQHEHGVDTVREIMNLLLLRGNIGREGAGPSPVRGHSNVQGNRTCGINHRPSAAFLDKLDEVCGIVSPREHGLDTVATIEAMNAGEVRVFVGMGGNFVMAAPDTAYTAAGLRNCDLTVQISTKLNRSHLVHGREALILPCLGRTEKDERAGGVQGQTVEDAMSMVHISVGKRRPASPQLLSEPAILTGIAEATLPDSATPWSWYADDYDRIRDVMAKVLPGFEGFNDLIKQPGGFRIPQPARERDFRTPSGKAEFSLAPLPNVIPDDADVLILQTMRSHDQWNTTIYSNNDRYRGIKNIRELIFLNETDMAERGLSEGDFVDITSTSKDGSVRTIRRFRALRYDLPKGAAAGYMPECNALIGIADYSTQSDQPLMKNVPVRVTASAE